MTLRHALLFLNREQIPPAYEIEMHLAALRESWKSGTPRQFYARL